MLLSAKGPPGVEKMPGSRAKRPGDIVTSLSGKTIEVLNTDAEGWMILAKEAGEKMWHMPLDDEYRDQLNTVYADIQSIGTRRGGACTAAMLLNPALNW